MKRKILFLVPLPPPVYGAAVSSGLCLKSKVLNEKFDIRHVRLNYSETLKDVGKLTFRKFFGFFITGFKIMENLISFRPHIVYFTIAPVGSGFLRDSFFVLLCKVFRKKIVFHVRGRGIKRETKNLLKYSWYRFIFKNTKVIILSELLYSDVRKIVDKRDIFVLPNAIKNEVSDNEFKNIIKKRCGEKIPTILFLSNMDETKGPFILLKACKLLKDQNITFRCRFVGAWTSNAFREKFETYVSKNNLDSMIQYMGVKTGNEKRNILSKSDILAFPTYYRLETFGLVILEAMQYGIPVIANGIVTIPSIVKHGETGFILEKNSPEELARHIKFLVKNKSKAIRLGGNGRKRFLEKYCFSEYETKIKAVFEKALGYETLLESSHK